VTGIGAKSPDWLGTIQDGTGDREEHAMRHMILAATIVFGISTAPALALDSTVIKTSPMSADALWKKVGDFCGIAAWHPAFEKCVLSADGKQRTLSLKGGGTMVEALERWDDLNHSYQYTIVSGPLPVTNYHSTINVTPDAKGAAFKWMGTYDANGAPDADAKKAVDGVYEAGAKTLTGG
jgi:polyketide cyclase/dehydrase/lipid transport protein